MTPQHCLAVEIMSECGMSPHEIVSTFGANGEYVDLVSVEKVLKKKVDVRLTKFNKRLYEFMQPGETYTTKDFSPIVKPGAARRICSYLQTLDLVESFWKFDPKKHRSQIVYRRTA